MHPLAILRAKAHPAVAARAHVQRAQRRNVARLALTALAFVLLSLGPSSGGVQAQGEIIGTAWLRFKNLTDQDVWIVVKYRDEGRCGTDDWTVRGWWRAESGKIADTVQLTYDGYYYYYAMGEDLSPLEGWEGSSPTYVVNDRFTWCKPDDRLGTPPASDYYLVDMVELSDPWPGASYIETIPRDDCPQPESGRRFCDRGPE